MSVKRTLLLLFMGWAVTVVAAQSAFAQNYARYCARDTDQLVNDLTTAITTQDENYLATLYNWAGFSAQTAAAKMDVYTELVNRSLVSVDPIGTGIAAAGKRSRHRPPVFAMSLLGVVVLSWLQALPPPVEHTPEIGPYPDHQEDPRGLGELPPLPQERAPEPPQNRPSTQFTHPVTEPSHVSEYDSERVLREAREASDRFEANLQRELRKMSASDGWDSHADFSGSMVPARAIRVVTEKGRIRPQQFTLSFGVMKFEDCYWLTGG